MSILLAGSTVELPYSDGVINYASPIISPPVINSVSGVISQGEIITINGSFSAKRNGQLFYLTGNPAMNGQTETSIVPINGSALNINSPVAYRHSTEQAFNENGASLKYLSTPGLSFGAHNPMFLLPERKKEIYYSYNFRVTINEWSSQAGAQIKMGRICSVTNSHTYEPAFGMTPMRNGTSTALDNYCAATTNLALLEEGVPAVFESTFNKWMRYEMWGRLPDYPSKNQAINKYWAGALNCADNKILITEESAGLIQLIDVLPDRNWEYSWAEKSFDKVLLPFYLRDWMDCYWYVDNVFINDSPERFELGNAPILEDCTKKVVQEQLTRTTNEMSVMLRMGNLTSSDNIYAFVVNSDGQKTSGTLIKEAV